MIGYATLGTNDIAAARTFYDALLGELGAKRLMDLDDGGRASTMWGMGWDVPALAVITPYDGQAAAAGNGNMVAIVVKDRAQVDTLHARAIDLGGRCEGPPGLRGDEGPQAFYAAYFRDPEGHKLCAYRLGPA